MKKHFFKILCVALCSVALGAPAGAQTSLDPTAPLPKDPAVITGTFPNGLTYYVRPNSKPEKKVELRLMVKAGSILETDDQQGLAHFMEHMNFNGTKNFQKNQLVDYLQSIGVKFGADLNAYTGFDQTVYILPIPTDKPGNLEKGFQIIEDWAHNALLTDKDIDEERGVVLEESRTGKGANDRMREKYFPKYVSGSKYAERLPIGKDAVLKNFKYEAVRSFYRDWYRPNLQGVAVVGDIDTGTAMRYLRKHFATLQNPASAPTRTYETVAPRTSPEAMVVTDKEASNLVLQILFPPTPDAPERTVGDYRGNIVRGLALQMLNQRLSDLAQSADPPFPFAQAGYSGLIKGYENLQAVTLFGPEGPEKALMALTAELQRARKYGFTQPELDRARAEMLAGMDQMYNERNTTESSVYVDEYVRVFLDEEPFPGIAAEREYYRAFLPGITLQEVAAQPAEWLRADAPFTLITAPDKAKLPSDKELLAMTKRGFAQEVSAPAEATAIGTSLLAMLPTPGKVTGTRNDKELGTTTYTLSNNVMVTVKPTTFKSDEIILTGVKRGGTGTYGRTDRSNVAFATTVVEAMGYGAYTPTDLERVLAGKTVSVGTEIGDAKNSVTASSSVADFETMLQLLHLQLTAPRRDSALFLAFKNKMTSMLAFMAANPQAHFTDTTVQVLYNNNPLRPIVIPKKEDFDALNLDRVMAIYTKEVSLADGYHFFIVGNVKPDTAVALIEKYIGSLPGTTALPYIKDNGVRPVTGQRSITVRRGTEKQSLINTVYHGNTPYSEDFSLKARLVTEVLKIRLTEELRERIGGVYSSQVQADVQEFPYPEHSVTIVAPCGPENVDTLIAATTAEVEKLQTAGPSTTDLQKVKTTLEESYRLAQQENGWWSAKLQDVLFWGRDKNRVLNLNKYITAVTAADLTATAKALFGANRFTSILYPEVQ